MNPDNGILYLDVSRVVTDAHEARKLAEEAEQEAFYDMQCKNEVYVLRGISQNRIRLNEKDEEE